MNLHWVAKTGRALLRVAALAPWFAACAPETGQRRVEVPLYVAGTDVATPFTTNTGASLRVSRASLAFGPLTLCAGPQAGEFCDTARLEWLDAALVDVTDETPVRVGELEGVTGMVRSWMYDLGLSSVLTSTEPFVHEAARELGDVSLRLELRTDVGGVDVPLTLAIRVAQGDGTERGVPVVRKSRTDAFEHDVELGEPGLLVRFDLAPWLADFEPGALVLPESCLASESVCDEPLVIDPTSTEGRKIEHALESGVRPTFEWGFAP